MELWDALKKICRENFGISRITKGFLECYWEQLFDIVVPSIDAIWTSHHMDPTLNQGYYPLGLGFFEDTTLYLEASNVNLMKCMSHLSLFSLTASLHLNLSELTHSHIC